MCGVIDLGGQCSIGTATQGDYRGTGFWRGSKEETGECNLEEKGRRGCCARVCCKDPGELNSSRTELQLGRSNGGATSFSTADLRC